MRHVGSSQFLILAASCLLTACAAMTQRSTLPNDYDCNGAPIVASEKHVLNAPGGDHLLAEGVDRRNEYGVCVVSASHTEALLRFMKGATTEEVALQMSIPPDDARRLITGALSHLRRRVMDY